MPQFTVWSWASLDDAGRRAHRLVQATDFLTLRAGVGVPDDLQARRDEAVYAWLVALEAAGYPAPREPAGAEGPGTLPTDEVAALQVSPADGATAVGRWFELDDGARRDLVARLAVSEAATADPRRVPAGLWLER